MRLALLAVAILLAGCLQNNLAPCGDNFCPPGKECHAPSGQCFGEDQLDACIGLDDRTPCSIGSFAGYCIDGVCLAPSCGDGIVQPEIGENCDEGEGVNSDEPNADCRVSCRIANCGDGIVDDERGEVCDDGNTDVNDQCAPDCGSNLTCGNGVVDLVEECDDNNQFARDGCSNCRNETLVVQQLTANGPRIRTGAAMAYDAGRERVVVFGGRARGGNLRNDTVEWDGFRWRELKPRDAPSGREAAGVAYDSKRHRVVLFGGAELATVRDDLWEFDGANWRERSAAVKPPARRSHAMAYDIIRDRLIVFGGRSGPGAAGVLADTWAYDGANWQQLSPALSPPALEGAQMAFDSVNQQLVLFGGRDPAGLPTADTWIWDGTTWSHPTVTASPTARFDHLMAWDASRGRIVLACGVNAPFNVLSDVHEWNGTTLTWTPATDHTFAQPGMSMAYDAARRQLVTISANFNITETRLRATTGEFNFPEALLAPPPRQHAAVAYDQRRGRLVMYGGHDAGFNTAVNETWEWDGSRWSRRTAAQTGNPKSRIRPTMTYSHKDGIVMGGGALVSESVDLWRYNGTSWTQIATPDPIFNVFGSPGMRFTASMSYDAKLDTLLFHGGFDNGQVPTTYSWNTTWSIAAESAGARHNFAMEYDPLREKTVIVGGHSQEGVLPTAFEFDGTAWTSIPEPPAGRGSRLVYDPHRKRLVYLVDPEDAGLEIWEFDGLAWTQRDPRPGLPTLYRPSVGYDQVRGEIVMFSGRTGGNGAPVTDATTAIGYQPNVAVEACTLSKLDYDGDGKPGCEDPDCAGRCTPTCIDGATCAHPSSTCGDGTCDPLEDCKLCPDDCNFPVDCPAGIVTECGDFRCDPGEICPADCAAP